jgi:hypothetical protein
MLRFSLAAIAAAILIDGPIADATVFSVSTLNEFKTALSVAYAGDLIEVHYGLYHVTSASDPKNWFKRGGTAENPVTIRGIPNPQGDLPVFDADAEPIDRAIFYVWDYTPNYVIENLEFRNARRSDVYPDNAAAAFILGDNITFRNCYSHDNDHGWVATDTAENTLLEYCHTAYNGKLPGASGNTTHNHYVFSYSITVRGCYIHHSTEGQNFKSRASHVVFEGNLVEDDGNYSWQLASNNAANSLMIGNAIVKGVEARNNRIIISVGEGRVMGGTLTMINNTIVSTGVNNCYITSDALAATDLVLYNNVFYGVSSDLFDWAGTGMRIGSHNWFKPGMTVPAGIADSLFGNDPGFVNVFVLDCHLKPAAAVRDVGTNAPQWLNRYNVWETRLPQSQYVEHAYAAPRPNDGQLDIGAFECFPGDADYDGDIDLDDLTVCTSAMNGPKQIANDLGADCDGDRDCDLKDIAILIQNFTGAL